MHNLNENNLNSILNSNEECIREGELLKYSFKHKRFDKRTVILDKEKLIIIRSKTKNQQPSNKNYNKIIKKNFYFNRNYNIIFNRY